MTSSTLYEELAQRSSFEWEPCMLHAKDSLGRWEKFKTPPLGSGRVGIPGPDITCPGSAPVAAFHMRNNRTSAFNATRRFPMSSSTQCMASWSVQMIWLTRRVGRLPADMRCSRSHGRPSTLSAKGRSCTRPKIAQIVDLTGRSSGGCRLILCSVSDWPRRIIWGLSPTPLWKKASGSGFATDKV